MLPATSRPLQRTVLLLAAVIALSVTVAGIVLVRAQLTHNSSAESRLALVTGHHGQIHAAAASSSPARVHDVLFVGASYTQGLGAIPQTDGYAYLIGRLPGWRAQIDGVSGTGYMNPGPRGDQTFAERVVHLPTEPRPDLVVFQGGRNDTAYPMLALRAAIIATVNATRARFHDAQIVFLGPIPAEVPVPRNQIAVENTLRAAAATCKVTFIDPIEQGWITPQNENSYEGHVSGHPDNDGYAYIAQRVTEDLNALLVQRNQY